MDPLGELFRYHTWATLTLMDHCAGLPAEALQATTPGTHGPLLPTFVHLVAAERRYLAVMTGEAPGANVQEGVAITLPELRERLSGLSAVWEGLLALPEPLNVTIPARGPFPELPHGENLLLLQALHHGNDHRTHICTILGANGLPVPEIDGWSYWTATHR